MLCPRVRPAIERLGLSSAEDRGRLFIKPYHSRPSISINAFPEGLRAARALESIAAVSKVQWEKIFRWPGI